MAELVKVLNSNILSTMNFVCQICHRRVEKTRPVTEIMSMHMQQLYPEGWNIIHGMMICNDHVVSLDIDGEKHYLWGKK